jgi:hypothetical protein
LAPLKPKVFLLQSEELLALPKVIEDWLSGCLLQYFFPFDHRLMSHGTDLSTLCACAVLLEQLKSPIFNLFKKLPNQKIIQKYLAQAYLSVTLQSCYSSLQ